MNKEKIIELKKWLENEDEVYYSEACHEILTYINELESENESCHEVLADLKAIIKQQNDRIAELEKQIKKNAFYAKGYAQGIKNTYEVVVPNKLKQFAESVKMEFYYEFDELIPSIMEDKIDKLLEEFQDG